MSDDPRLALVPFENLDGLRLDNTDNAKRLAAMSDGRLRDVHKWGKYIVYGDDGVWHLDFKDASRAQEELDDLVARSEVEGRREILTSCYRLAIRLGESRTQRSGCSNMAHQARGIGGMVIEHEKLKAHPYLVNMANGTMDFGPVTKDAKLSHDERQYPLPVFRDHDPEDLLLVQSPPVEYDADARSALWLTCLEQRQPDKDVRDYLQMRVGACILGVATPTLDVDFGGGGNGKSKFHGAIQHVLGDDAMVPHKFLLVSQRSIR